MRFASWNMSHAIKRDAERRAAAWNHLRHIGVDVAMVQEAGLPIIDVEGSVIGRNHGTHDWMTAVVSYGPPLAEVNEVHAKTGKVFRIPDIARPGTLALARIDIPATPSVVVVSLYGRLRYVAQSVLRAASDLLPLFLSPLGKRVILAGDLNMHTAARDDGERSRAAHRLGLLEAFGLHDLVRQAKESGKLTHGATPCPCKHQPCSHVMTYRRARRRPDAVGSFDYMYATPELARRLQTLEICNGDNDPAWSHSDHAPIIAAFKDL